MFSLGIGCLYVKINFNKSYGHLGISLKHQDFSTVYHIYFKVFGSKRTINFTCSTIHPTLQHFPFKLNINRFIENKISLMPLQKNLR